MTPNLPSDSEAAETDAQLDSLVPRQAPGLDGDREVLAEIFHERTKYHRASFAGQGLRIGRYLRRPALIARGIAGYHDFPHLDPIDLPEPAPLPAELGAVLRARISCRAFAGPLSLEQVSSLLGHALRCNRAVATAAVPGMEMVFRPYPSAGNLNAIETYAFLNEIAGVPSCLAHYSGRTHRLRILRRFAGNLFARSDTAGEAGGTAAALAIVFTMLPQRMTAKYGDRGYRFALLEAGHASQNLCLAAGGLGLGSLVYGSYYDEELATTLGIDGVTETVASAVLVGPPKSSSQP